MSISARLTPAVLLCIAITTAGAAVAPEGDGRFDALVRYEPGSRLGTIAETPEELPDFAAGQAGWADFRKEHGDGWRVSIDRRSGTPTLVEGRGIPWFAPGSALTLDLIEAQARDFVGRWTTLLRIAPGELVLDRAGSGATDPDRWVVVFRRAVDGVPVADQRLLLFLNHGRLVAFGADRWGALERRAEPRFGSITARELLHGYMGLLATDVVEEIVPGELAWIAVPPSATAEGRYTGVVGAGIDFRLVWSFVLRVAGERGTWVGRVDAETGEVLALYDDDRYAQVRGGVYPMSNDGNCPAFGCELPGFPMPYANVMFSGTPVTSGDMGIFDCAPDGATASTSLAGPYVRIADVCGVVSESVVCEEDLELGTSGGTDCAVPPGDSAGNTHSARTNFYHLNRVKEKVRYYLPANTWVNNQVTANVNVNATCNASWNGSTNMYKSGGGCSNTGELAGVVNHELGHGVDQNDGGGYDNSSEAYADVIAILEDHQSCVGRNFRPGVNCSGYGDTCLDCTGIRDKDWDKRVQHTPATPANFIDPNCGGGSGPCGRQVHCESYPPAEAIWDLARRDLPAAGMDAASAWQLTQKLFYKSRQGSGGNTHNCALPNSDGCGATTWFTKLRNADDDDGNLNNGTPHAAAIFAAFQRHAMACGAAGDASNQSASACTALVQPQVTALAGSNSASLSWAAVSGAARYLILRNDVSCDYSFNVIATVDAPATSYVDEDLPNDFTVFYRVQAQGSNVSCDGPVSACQPVVPQPFAGSIKLDRPSYACSATIQITVRDANVGAAATTATIVSTTEPAGETVTLTETAPGSAKYVGTIPASGQPASSGDGVLSIATGDAIQATYIDADDGLGGTNLPRQTSAGADCVAPSISQVTATGITSSAATITWTTDEASSSIVHWGETKPPANLGSTPGLVTSHSVPLTGLQACTIYHYSVESQDAPGNLVVDDKAGAFFTFETQGIFDGVMQPCHAGRLSVVEGVLGCTDSLSVKVVDIDLNVSVGVIDSVAVTVTSSTDAAGETLVLTETGANTATFTGSISTVPGAAVPGDGLLQTSGGDLVTATYRDGDDGTGSPAVSFESAVADCAGPGLSAVRVVEITDDSASVRWSTSEPSTSRVDWGTTPALGQTVTASPLVTSHALTLAKVAECERVYFRVSSTDTYGNTRIGDDHGVPFAFNAFRIPGVFRDEFEAAGGWTLEGEWQIAPPEGKGSSPADPTAAFQGTRVLGQDLTGLGAHPGDYENNTSQRAMSPTINGTSLVGTKLKFRRWLNTSSGSGYSYVEVWKNNAWNTVWTSSPLGQTESEWTLQTVDISAFADGNAGLRIAFRQNGGFGSVRSGWNVDRVVVKDASTPDFDACGACGGAPTFAGLETAEDLDGCADTGVLLTWKAAPAWGTGHAGSYSIYRDASPSFVPSAANRVATGVTATSWDDLGAPNGVTSYYIVRAENDETCSGGPANGGVTDANLVRVAVRDDVSQPNPGDVGASLSVGVLGGAHVKLDWAATPSAAAYRVFRGSSPAGPFTAIAEVTSTSYEDRDQMADSASRYYVVRAIDSCGNEGP